MPQNNNILELLNIQDKRIELYQDYYKKEIVNGEQRNIIRAKLSYEPKYCYHCGTAYGKRIIKHGYKSTKIKLLKTALVNTYLVLDKQRYLCKHCNRTFILNTTLVDKYCFISNKVKAAIALDLTSIQSIKDIAKKNSVSTATIYRVIASCYKSFKRKLNYLPRNLCFDEFKSVKAAKGSMSFIYCNADTGELINIVEDRRLFVLKKHFYRYSKKARNSVKKIVIDMYSPYISLIKEVFPNAKIIIDRFHLVQLISRAFNKTRIRIMKQFPYLRKKLKRYWKLLLKPRHKLNCVNFRKVYCFKRFMSEQGIVDYLLDMSEELKANYYLYHNLHYAISTNDIEMFEYYINNLDDNISNYMITSINSYKRYLSFVKNSFAYPLSNGKLEGLIGKIKVIKRIAFGYKSFFWFKTRIFITQKMLYSNI